MNIGLRRRHRRIAWVLAVLLPALLILIFAQRRPLPRPDPALESTHHPGGARVVKD